MSAITVCPSPDRLRALLDGMLPDAEQTELTEHLNSCTVCRQRLEGLAAGGESLSDVARNLQTLPPLADAPPPAVIEKIKEAGSETVSQPAANMMDDPTLNFLRPSAKPGYLGRLGDFEIEKVIGRGGMGVVFKAFDETLHRVVALKAMAPQLAANAAARKRFEREGRAAAAVSHDHVVAIHRVAEDNGLPYIVMQFVSGESLQDRLDRTGPFELKEILRIGLQAAGGLAAAHAQGLIHRDIKPANILLENGISRVKITDFGLARAVDDASVTQSGVITGTPMYMAPEQASGEPVDHRADLFSLGSVLYALCTGHPPFRATGTMAVLMRVIEDTPRPIREINPDIPDWLCDIIAKLQAKNPADRFQTAKEVSELLGQHLAHLQRPTMVPRPEAVVSVAPQTAPTERVWKQLLDETDHAKRLAQHGLLIGGVLLLIAASAFMILSHSRGLMLLGGLPLAAGMVMVIAAGYIKQSWTIAYKGRSLRFENSVHTGGRLFLDDKLLAVGGIGMLCELHGTIPDGPGAGDAIRVFAHAGFLSFRCRIDASDSLLRPGEIPTPARMRRPPQQKLIIAALVFVAAIGCFALAEWKGWTSFLPATLFGTNPSKGNLMLIIAEPHAAILIDGRDVGKTEDTETTQVFEVSPGKHIVEIQKDARLPYREAVEIRSGEWKTLAVGQLFAGYPALEGRWTVVGEDASGVSIPRDMRNLWWQFQGAQILKKFDAKDDPSISGYRVDTSKTPNEIDLVSGDQTLARGIFVLKGDELTVCFSKPPEARPKSFVTRMNTSLYLTVLRREPPPATDGFVQLFNGKDLTGWKKRPGQPGNWQVVNGILVGSDATTFLLSERGNYRDFHLRIEAAVNTGGYGGAYFRIPESALPAGDGIPEGFYAQFNATRTDVNRTGSLFGNHVKPFVVVPTEAATPKANEWFEMEIIAKDRMITIKINGQTSVDYIDTRGNQPLGHLALLCMDANTAVRFRKIEIKEMPVETKKPVAEPGFVPLFNGKDLTGWKSPVANEWKVEKGLLVSRGKATPAGQKINRAEAATFADLYSEREDFENFHLRYETKIIDGGLSSSDVAIRIDGLSSVHVTYSARLRAFGFGATGPGLSLKASFLADDNKPETPPNTWLECEIIADGPFVTFKVNGKTCSVQKASSVRRGAIGLTVTTGAEVYYRKIEIQELPPSPGSAK